LRKFEPRHRSEGASGKHQHDKGGGANQESVADIIDSALKILTDVEDSGDVRVIQTALRELRYAFKLFAPYAQVRKVTIFGSARTLPTRIEYQQAMEFGRKITAAGFMVITGAGGGIGVEHCAVTDDRVRCAVEYNCVRWGSHDLPPQAGLCVYERGPGLLAAARAYDDVEPPIERS
jgi:hypothetical protein